MRSDFNKLLTESPRLGNQWKFRDIRNSKGNAPKEDDIGGKQSIHAARRNTGVRRRRFNENLNTLRRFIQSNVGRPWNKVYGEICENFDKRKVVNDHILVHLFQFVEIDTKMVDGKVCVLNSYFAGPVEYVRESSGKRVVSENEGYYNKRWRPIELGQAEWYVHPVDGLLKANKKRVSYKKAAELREKQASVEKAKVFRQLNKFEELHFENGNWFLYTLKVKPKPERVFGIKEMPDRYFRMMSPEEQKERGAWYYREVGVHSIDPPKYAHGNMFQSWRKEHHDIYYAKREAASKKLLKEHGLIGTATFDEGASTSRHEAYPQRNK